MAHRTLFLIQTELYPLTGGVSLRNWQNITLMRTYGEVGIFSIYQGAAQRHLPAVQGQFALWQHHDWSSPTYSQWDKVQRRLWRVRPGGNARADWLYSQALVQQLKATLQAFRPTLIIVEEIWLFRYLPTLKVWGCPIVLDNHNVEGDDSRYPKGSPVTAQRLQKVRYIEQQFIQHTNQVWMCSQQDIHRLQQLYPTACDTAQLHLVPNGVDPDAYVPLRSHQIAPPTPLREPAPTLIYLGRFSYEPNAEAAEILLREIFPAVKATINNSRLLLVGCDPTNTMQRLAQSQPNVIVTGRVDDIKPYLAAATVMVVPLRKGSGTRLKLLEAFAANCPVVSTAKGAEGLVVEDGKHLLIRDTPAAMVDAIQVLFQRPQQRQSLAQMAYQRFLSHYAWPAVNRHIQSALNHLLPPQ